ncbi:uncharacterized protein RCC_07065 [Ramularia collo-cygni]|uniref:Uncharacterized protein n=1 Tax=Ramularia collo-cygni TaxID=112498 RepID=A0A2D3VJS3_9PEZI|nr:uncharacterized protein RCC_07065 [Ramularia collo-cygni]CZT21203.1 uncharacterized protein RCC_07065 [Ramularia collo-cygni]
MATASLLFTSEMPSAMLPTTVPIASPFLLREDDLEVLSQSDGFTILRAHLAAYYSYEACDSHSSACPEDVQHWTIVRDILHALLVPVVELFDKACGVAAAATNATKLEDLEYAFTGSSRGAFVWLQCFLSSEKERDWCFTRGCPACVVEHTLSSEFSIRLIYAACLLSDVHYPFTMEGPTLPSFTFFLDSLARAISEDEVFGEDFFDRMQPKAWATRDGVDELIQQCLDLDIALSQPTTPDGSAPTSPASVSPALGPCGGTPGMKIKRSKMARRQMKLQREEEAWMEEMLRNSSERLRTEAYETARPASADSLLVALKDEAAVLITEIDPE